MKLAVSPDVLLHAVQVSNRGLTGAQIDKFMGTLLRGESPCCNAGIDESEVEPRGRKRGTGPRTCSKCGRELFRI